MVKIIFCLLIWLGFVNIGSLFAQTPTRYDSLATLDYRRPDSLAKHTPSSATVSIQALANHLTQGEDRDLYKVRAIFRWITFNVNYDAQQALTGRFKDNSAPAVLRTKYAVCEGYSNLFRELCKSAGIECVTILGFGKGFNYKLGQKITRVEGHAWNGVRLKDLNNEWFLIDATWATGYIQNSKFVRHFSSFYFLTDPTYFVWTHFPKETRWQLLAKPISLNTFELYPQTLFVCPFKPITPLAGIVQKNEEVEVKIQVPGGWGAILLGGKEVVPMTKTENDIFTGRVIPKEKELSVGVRMSDYPEGKYDVVIIYLVK